MKVNVYETVEWTDEQRVQYGAIIDGKVKPKRQATRDEMKAFTWRHGEGWATVLSDEWAEFQAALAESGAEEPESEPSTADEDLLGGSGDTGGEDLLGDGEPEGQSLL